MIEVKIRHLPHAEGLPIPHRATEEAAGFDLAAAVAEDQPLTLAPGARLLVPTGIIMQLPEGFEGQIRPRSGLALRHGITVLNAPGTVDSDYRGEVQVLLINHGDAPFAITRGLRIAQLVIAPVSPIYLMLALNLDDTRRGSGGFGSTGLQGESAQ
ncbi:deoxyuridine 5'-triphosphate nucleotidohydrolase [Agaricicola taiwanensis]|uniref:Deoxyuridine 5'-triphosphate nucleotidohydrolase n=1 Tax=Agaricicola taiwanensis TaxID=591372 RepID=A0A8J2YAJ7_9RHOB|nr:dUTP diphosphatase [Agaricicola taiwanensis]GGE29462.1 deoxyuridine 5'-triphosphate nucleotidohydrolase [Agaricicola taiwanensis]